MKDCVGNELKVDDLVVTNHVHYKNCLMKCKVIGFSEKKIRLIPVEKVHSFGEEKTTRFPEQVAKIYKQDGE